MTSLELKILKLAQGWVDANWIPGKDDDTRQIRLHQWMQRHACGQAILKLYSASRVKSVG